MARDGRRGIAAHDHYALQLKADANGKVDRLIDTILSEAIYAPPYTSEAQRERALRLFDDHYHLRRRHGALGGLVPMHRLAQDLVNNLPGHVI